MIVRDSTWPLNVSLVATTDVGHSRLVSRNRADVDFPKMIETIVTNCCSVTITDVDTYEITKTPDAVMIKEQHDLIQSKEKGKGGKKRAENHRVPRLVSVLD